MTLILILISNFIHSPIKVFINEADNEQAAQAVDIVLTFIKKNPGLGLSVKLMTVDGNRTDSRKFLENSKQYF